MEDDPTRLVSPVLASRYELLAAIASGGMATVYVARQLGAGGFQRIVAIKRMHPHIASNPEIQAMFREEARIASLIHHPNVVAIHDVYETGGERVLVMDFVDGISLGQLRKALRAQGKAMPVRVLLRIVVDTLRGLHAAHEQTGLDGLPLQVVHRDATPQNILVGCDGSVRVTDFGIARAEQRTLMTEAGQAKGKFAYMAPEQCAGGVMDRRVDLFAIGVVLWELLTGRALFHGENDAMIISQVTAGKYPSPSEFKAEIPPTLEVIVMKALSLDPRDRFPTACTFADTLEAFARDAVGTADAAEVGKFVMDTAGGVIANRRQVLQDVMAGRRPKVPWGIQPPMASGSSSSSANQFFQSSMTLDSHLGPYDGSAPATGFGKRSSPRMLALWVGSSALASSLMVAVLYLVFRSPDVSRADSDSSFPTASVSAAPGQGSAVATAAPAGSVIHVRIEADDEIVEIRVPDGNDVEIARSSASFTALRGTRPIPVFVRLADGSTIEESVVPTDNAVIKVRSSVRAGGGKPPATARPGQPAAPATPAPGGLKYESNPYE